jgi:cytochrome oxidase assembly protein ShyY1
VLAGGAVPDDVEWRTVRAAGEYVAAESVLIVNRSQSGAAGRDVVTPLRLDDGELVLVNRGFVPDTEAVPAPPSGRVEVEGRARASEERRLGPLTEGEGEQVELQRIDIERIAHQIPGTVVPVFIERVTSDPAEGALPAPVPRPTLSEGPHLSYAIQWFIFSVCAVVGWVLAVRRSRPRAGAAPTTATT